MKHNRVRLFQSGIFLTSLTCILIFIVLGCATMMKKRPEGPRFQPASAAEKDITVSIRQLGREELVKNYKTIDNPYISPGSLFGGNEMIVFELTVTAPSEVKIVLKTIEFHFGSNFTRPTSRSRLSQDWELRIQKQDTYNGWTSARVTQIINRTMVPDKLILKPNESYTGLVVFMGRFPDYGEASFYLPVYTKNDELIHLFKL